MKVLDTEARYKAVAFSSAMVSLGLLTMDEFMSVMVGIDEAQIDESSVSETFLRKLADLYGED